MKNVNKKYSNTNKFISYSSFLRDDGKEDTNKNKEIMLINNNVYINIDSKNNIEETSEKELRIINQRILDINEIKSNSNDEISKEDLTKQITKKFLDKLYPKCETSARKISLLISREIRLIKKLSKDVIEEYINYFYSLRHDIKYSRTLKLTTEVFRNIGYILCYIYSKFTQFSMKE